MNVVQGGKAVDGVDSKSLVEQGPDPRLDSEGVGVPGAQLGHVVGDDVKITGYPKGMALNVGCYAAVIDLDDNLLYPGSS